MTDVSTRTTQLIQNLYAEDSVKQELLNAIKQQGVNQGILEKVRDIIDSSVTEFEKESEAAIQKIEFELSENLKSIENEYSLLEDEVKAAHKETLKQQDTQEIDKIRKQLGAN